MQPKKSQKANLEPKRPIFFMIGVSLALLSAIAVFEYTSVITVEKPPVYTAAEDKNPTPITVWKEEKPQQQKQQQKQETKPQEANILNIKNFIDFPTDEGDDEPEVFDGPLIDVDADPDDEIGEVEEISIFGVERMAVPYECEALVDRDEQMACLNRFISKYVAENIHYSQNMVRQNISGKVFVKFTFDTDGTIYASSIEKGLDPELDAEVLRVINSLPKFRPAGVLNRNVRMVMTLPVSFKFN